MHATSVDKPVRFAQNVRSGQAFQPSVMGSRGGATTLLYVVLIVALWLSITGRSQAITKALAPDPTPGTSNPTTPPIPGVPTQGTGTLPQAIPHQNPDGSWSLPGLTGPIGGHGH